MSSLITSDQVRYAADEFWKALDSVPFGNSEFQLVHFVAQHLMDARSYRQVLLELFERAKALHHNGCLKDRSIVNIRMKKRQIADKKFILSEETDSKEQYKLEDEIELLEIDVREAQFDLKGQEKLFDDAMRSVETLLKVLARLPACTREQFEAQEPLYWRERLLLQAKQEIMQSGSISAGCLDSLFRIGLSPETATLVLSRQIASDKKQAEQTLISESATLDGLSRTP